MQEVGGEDPGGLCVQELPPGRSVPAPSGFSCARRIVSRAILRTVAGRPGRRRLLVPFPGGEPAVPGQQRRPCRHVPGDRWFADETYVKVAGRWTYLYRAIGQHGQVIDALLSQRRDLAAARRFFTRALRAGTIPAEVTTDRARPIRGSSTN